MDLFDRFAGNDSWHTRRLLEYASTLTEEQLDRPLPTVVELLPWRESNKTRRQLLENIVFTKEVWTAALSGAELEMNGPPKSKRSPKAMLERLEKTDAELHRILGDVRKRSAWDDGTVTVTVPGRYIRLTHSANRLRPSRSAVSLPIS
jgi:AraC family transcriptional regulator